MSEQPAPRTPKELADWIESHRGGEHWRCDSEPCQIEQVAAESREAEALRLPGHKHEIMAAMPDRLLMEGRSLQLGRLMEPIPGAEHEQFCLHVTTPFKGEVVFGLWEWDLAWLAALAEAQNGQPLNPRWITKQAASLLREGSLQAASTSSAGADE